MSHDPVPTRPAGRAARRAAAAVLLLAALAAGAWWWAGRDAPRPVPVSDDPRLTFATPYRNVRPDVEYVGDAACAECHDRICNSYHAHPMGRSAAPVSANHAAGRLGPDGRSAFDAGGFRYSVERREGRLWHRETFAGEGGRTAGESEAAVEFVVGSGRRGGTYLYSADGFLFQSPVSWYTAARRWDLSPGYRDRNAHFDRPVTAACLFCHCDHAEPVEHTLNRYRAPILRGPAVGCERCHGPGQLHVARHQGAGTPEGEADDTLVNPRRLPPALRESVCQQCHLQGQARVLRHGRGPFDYRPGLPLELFWAVFVLPAEASRPKAVGQVEQMYQSRCFRSSDGRMGCASCHDPHQMPPAGGEAAYYRVRCLSCHKERSCTAPSDERKQKADACTACHMTRLNRTDVVHVSVTDHRILRTRRGEEDEGRPAAGGIPLVPFHDGPHAPGKRDLGVGLAQLAAATPPGKGRSYLAGLAVPLLRDATERTPHDLAAWEQLGYALRCEGRLPQALEAYESALAKAPGREVALAGAAEVAGQLGRGKEAEDHGRRAVAVSPRRPEYHVHLAQRLAERRAWDDALAECDSAIRLNPAGVNAHVVRVACLLDSGRKEEARKAFAVLLALKPPQEEELKRWFETQSKQSR